MKEHEKKLLNERREDEITSINQKSKNNQPLPQPKDYEEIEY